MPLNFTFWFSHPTKVMEQLFGTCTKADAEMEKQLLLLENVKLRAALRVSSDVILLESNVIFVVGRQ